MLRFRHHGCRNVPFRGRARARLTGAVSKGGKMCGVATNVYLWETSEKPKETGRNENSKFGSCIYVWGRYWHLLRLSQRTTTYSIELWKLCYLNFCFFLFFEVDKSGAFAPTYPPSKRKSNLRSSFLCVNQVILFTWKVIILRRWTLKMIHFTW